MIKHVIFDLGNVLIHIHPEKTLQQFADFCGFSVEKVKEFFNSPIYWDHMAGLYSPEVFYQKVIRAYPCTISMDEFKKIWNSVIGVPKEGIESLIHQLKENYSLSVCSNTDPWHWQKVMQEVSFMTAFTKYFLSFEMKMNKPDPRIFASIPEQLNCDAQECLFIDDIRVNVDQANLSGFHTILASEPVQIGNKLKQEGILK
jgi:putative hydrolase of the HAD superfamily